MRSFDTLFPKIYKASYPHVRKNIYNHIILESFFLILDLFLLRNSFHMENVIKWLLDFVEALQSVLV